MSQSELDKIIDKQVQEFKDAEARFKVAVYELSKSVQKAHRSNAIKRGLRAKAERKNENNRN